MRKGFGREITLLCLPVLLIGGVAWWQNRAALVPAATVSVPLQTRLPGVPKAQLNIGTIELFRMGPVYSQNVWNDYDYSVTVPLQSDAMPVSWLQLLQFRTGPFISENGLTSQLSPGSYNLLRPLAWQTRREPAPTQKLIDQLRANRGVAFPFLLCHKAPHSTFFKLA